MNGHIGEALAQCGDELRLTRIAQDVERFDVEDDTVLVEAHDQAMTMVWTTPLSLAESSPLFSDFLNNAEHDSGVACITVAANGSAYRDMGSENANVSIKQLGLSDGEVALFRLEMDVRGIGYTALSYTKDVPGLRASSGTLSVTAPDLDHRCLEKFFSTSTRGCLTGMYEGFRKQAEALQADALKIEA
jgi:hypothetical protein